MGLAKRAGEGVCMCVCVRAEKVFAVSKAMKGCEEDAIVCDDVHLCVADTEVRNKSASACVYACQKERGPC